MHADCRLRGGDFESLRKLKVRKEINNQSLVLLGKGKFACQSLKEN